MTDYDDFVEDSRYLAAVKDTEKTCRDVERVIRRVRKLAEDDPDAVTFEDLRIETKKAIEKLDQKETIRQDLIADNCEDYEDNENYLKSLNDYDSMVMQWSKLLSKESVRIYGSSTPVKADQSSDSVVQAMLAQMKTQNDLIQSCVKANTDQNVLFKASVDASIGKNNGPRPPTPASPSFCPAGDLHDSKKWREFIENFEYFTSSIPLKRTKLLHLRTCLKGRAQVDIQHLTLTDENYDLALKLLEEEYANPELTQHKTLLYIHKCNLDTSDKTGRSMLHSIKQFRNQLVELKATYKLDFQGLDFDGDGNPIDKPTPGSTLIAAYLHDKIPGHIQLALWQLTRKKYPTLQEILNNIKEAVEISEINFNKSSQVPKNKPESGSTINTPSSSVASNMVASKPNKFKGRNKKKYFNHNCIYCQSSDHIAAHCPVENTAAKRKFIIRQMSDKYQECDFCMRHPKGDIDCYRRGKCRPDCKANSGKLHAMDLCFKNLKKNAHYGTKTNTGKIGPVLDKSQVNNISFCPDLVQENINGVAAKAQRAIALSTATFNCLNEEVMHLSPDKKLVGVLMDNAAQRSLVTKDLVKRLGIKILSKV